MIVVTMASRVVLWMGRYNILRESSTVVIVIKVVARVGLLWEHLARRG
jgi:hypothetical protein